MNRAAGKSKVGRNSKCPCGSGNKYKNCCLRNTYPTNPKVTLKDICELLKLGLHAEGVTVLDVRLMNNTVFLVEFIAKSRGSIDVKAEIGSIIAFMSGFFRDNENAPNSVTSFAAKGFNDEKKPLVHAISSLDVAKKMSKGLSIEWLQNTIFQDYTDDYRQGIAKRRISELENGLRLLICSVLTETQGSDWWNVCVSNKVKQSKEEMYESAEGISCKDGDTLIYYTYLLELRKIIVSNWSEFVTVFASQKQFSDLLEQLNLIRREEAHNRVISDDDLSELESIYSKLMGQIAAVKPSAANNYLVDNWRIQLREIFSTAAKEQVYLQTGVPLNVTLISFRKQIDRYKDIQFKVSSLVIPPHKKSLHAELESLLEDVISAMENIMEQAIQMDFKKLETAQLCYQKAQQNLAGFREKFLMSELG